MSNSKSVKTPAERLKEITYKMNVSEIATKTKRKFNSEAFLRKAKEVRKTFKKDGNILPSEFIY